MTKLQYRIFNKLKGRQVNHDASVVETNELTVTIHIPFPGLYLTYGPHGELLQTETEVERKASGGVLMVPGKQLTLSESGVGSDNTEGMTPYRPAPDVLDDDVPF